jgi:lipopolysaccharide transport system ATP-binding protein
MSHPIIQVEGVGKRYLIKHQQREKYTTLRDTIMRKVASWVRPSANDADSIEEFWALRELSFEIEQGERVGVIGRNGAGKSTLLKLLSRITEPTTGRIGIKGRLASLLEVGTGFHPELTGRENVFLNGAILGMHRHEIQRKFDQIVQFAEVEKFLDTPVKRYSSGMYVRLAFSVAAHLEPEILVVDEVLAVGDMQFQKKCLTKMEEVSKHDGLTLLFVSHNLGIVSQLCNTGIFLKEGRLVRKDPIEQVMRTYLANNESDSVFTGKDDDQKDFIVQSVKIIDAEGNINAELMTSDTVTVEIGVKINRYRENAVFLVAPLDYMKQRVCAIYEYFADVFDPEKKQQTIRLVMPANFFVPGQYSLHVAAFVPLQVVFDTVTDICPFTIVDGGTRFAHLKSGFGAVFLNDYQILKESEIK